MNVHQSRGQWVRDAIGIVVLFGAGFAFVIVGALVQP